MTQKEQPSQPISGNILTRIALELGQHKELPEILRVVLEGFKEMLDARKALFAICDEDGRIQQAVVQGLVWSGDLDDLPISKTTLREAFQEDGPILLADALSNTSYAARTSIRQNELRMIVALPVKGQSGPIGMLYADSPRRARQANFNQMSDSLQALAILVSLVVENARLYAEQRFRARYLARLAHDLRGHLHGSRLNAEYLQTTLKAQTPDQAEAQRHLGAGHAEMHRLLVNSDSVAEQAAIESPERISLMPMLRSLASQNPPLAREHNLTITLSAPASLPRVIGWSSQLRTVLDNLLSNALKFADDNTTITISAAQRSDRCPPGVTRRTTGDAAFLFQQIRPLTPDPDQGYIEIGFHNHGPPIAPALLPRLFEAYICEGGTRRGVRSTGLGLAIVAETIERMGGRVWVDSAPNTGTTVRFTLPRRIR